MHWRAVWDDARMDKASGDRVIGPKQRPPHSHLRPQDCPAAGGSSSVVTWLEEEAIMTSASSCPQGTTSRCCSSGSHILTLPHGSGPHLRGAEERDPGEGDLQWRKTSPVSRVSGSRWRCLFVFQKGARWQLKRAPLWSFTTLSTHKDLWPEAAMGSRDLLHHHLVYLFRGPAFRKGTVLGAVLKRSLAIVINNIDRHRYSH